MGSIPGSGRCPGERNELDKTYRINNNNKRELQFRLCNHGVWVCAICSSCLILCDPMEYSPPGSSVHGISQARLLEWLAMLSSRGSSQPTKRTHVSCSEGRFFTITSSGEPHTSHHMEREREHFHRGEEEAERDIVNKVHPWFFIAESLPGKKRSLFSYWALLLSNSKGWESISFWSPNSTELRLLFINFFKIMVWKKITKICKTIIFKLKKKKDHKMNRTEPVQYKWDQLKDWVDKWLTLERVKATPPIWLP